MARMQVGDTVNRKYQFPLYVSVVGSTAQRPLAATPRPKSTMR